MKAKAGNNAFTLQLGHHRAMVAVQPIERWRTPFGVPVGHEEFIKAQLETKSMEQLRLLETIPAVEEVQAGVASLEFLRSHTFQLRPELTAEFAART